MSNNKSGTHYSTHSCSGSVTVMSPLLIFFCISRGSCPSTVHPMETHVPSISMTVPTNNRAWDLPLIVFAHSQTSLSVRFPLCRIPFSV